MIGYCEYTYDENGNSTMREDTATNAFRQMQWDSRSSDSGKENRLTMLSRIAGPAFCGSYTSRYTYNHGGERVIKSHGGSTGVFINASPQGVLYHDADNYTLYVSPYMVVSKDRFTKHYYAGTQRLVSKIGVGDFNNLYVEGRSNVTAGQKDYAARIELIESGRSEYYAELGIPPGPPTSKGIFGEPEYSGSALTNGTLGNYDIPDNWPQPAIKNGPGDVPGPPVQYGDAVNPDVVEPGYGYSTSVAIADDDIYFYHSDHLGSTSYITDLQGNPTQFVCYMPFGEAFVDEHTTRTEMPFKFNGKEQDAETGLYYYGARYYDPLICRFYGVDRFAEKYSSWSPYCYTLNNPISNIDINGDTVTVQVTNKVVGTTNINLFSSGEVGSGTTQETKEVNVYEVNVSNESGSSSTFYYTRDGYRKDADNPDDDAKNVTFDVRNDGDSFQGKIKSRWSGTDNVLELRKFDDVNDQTVEAMKGGEDANRAAIQFHLKGATDGCLLSVGSNQFNTTAEGVTINSADLSTSSSGSQTNFMNKVKDFRTADVDAGKSNFIKVTFQKN